LEEENVPLPDFDIKTNNVINEIFVTISEIVDILKIIESPNSLTKGKSTLISIETDKISQHPENCENRNDPDLVQAFLKYRNVMTKLNENNVTHVIQTMTSMNYFDSSRKNLTYILNKNMLLRHRLLLLQTT
jgi:hypothetical protein